MMSTASVKDPVCGMASDAYEAAGKSEYQGVTYHFCSAGCKDKFDKDPEHYLNQAKQDATPAHPDSKTESPGAYTCPMHPEIVRDAPGLCPICGMALEPREAMEEDTNPELADMTRRLWISVALALPMLALMVSAFLPSMPMQHLFSARVWAWIEFVLTTPVVLWCGLPFFVRGWQSVAHRSPNMFTLISLGTGSAYIYSVLAT